MGNITKSLWHLVTDAANEAAPDGADRLPIAQQPGVSYITQWRYVTVAALLGLIPPASVFVDEGLSGDGTVGNPINVNVDNLTVFIDPITNELEAAVIVDEGLTGDSLNIPLSVLVDGVTIQIDPITNELEAIGGAGAAGNSIYSTAFGSEPGAPNTGDVDLYSNSPQLARWDGSLWEPFGPIFRFMAPIDGDFAWVNQTTATKDTTRGGVLLYAPAAAGDSWKIRNKAAPVTPYYIVMAFIPNMRNSNNARMGFTFRQSSDGKLRGFSLKNSGWELTTMTNPTTFSVANGLTSFNFFFDNGAIHWIQVTDDGVDRKGWWSNDGQLWAPAFSEGRTSVLTADGVGFYVDPNNASFGLGMTLLSWEEFDSFQGILL